jgi:EPS-associated MarR family transcriptional regulator
MDESHFKALREISRQGELSQRDISRRIGLSLGRVNYIVNSLIEKGFVKAHRFKNSRNKMGYIYLLTPTGMAEKVRITRSFLVAKTREYERLSREIEELRHEVTSLNKTEKRA